MDGAPFNYSFGLLLGNAWEVFQEFIQGNALFKVLKQTLHGHATTLEDELSKLDIPIDRYIIGYCLHDANLPIFQ